MTSVAVEPTSTREIFGQTPDGQDVERVTLSDGVLTLSIISFGAVIQDLRHAEFDHPLVLGFDTLEGYLADGMHIGAVAGRVANRISGASFKVNGRDYEVDANFAGRHCIHSGREAQGRENWRFDDVSENRVTLILTEPDGHIGFPGPCTTEISYTLLGNGILRTDFRAITEQPTPMMPTQHSYFNLDADLHVRNTTLDIQAERYLETDTDLIPTGEILPLKTEAFDFSVRKTLAAATTPHDRSYVLTRGAAGLRFAARATPAGPGPRLEVWTDQPIVHLYDGQNLPEGLRGLEGRQYGPFAGFCLETHGFPNSVNIPSFPQTTLWPGEVYTHRVEYRFSA